MPRTRHLTGQQTVRELCVVGDNGQAVTSRLRAERDVRRQVRTANGSPPPYSACHVFGTATSPAERGKSVVLDDGSRIATVAVQVMPGPDHRSIARVAISDGASAVDDLRALARDGLLTATFVRAAREAQRNLFGATMAVASPVVFTRLTRVQERRRGHAACAVAIPRLADACLDRFYDDLEAVVEYFLTHAAVPIRSIEAWIASRLQPATVDAHRRRRSGRGALQRPRLPGWLRTALHGNAWLERLAIEILVWVGVTATAGNRLWPLDSWAELRGQTTGDWSGSDPRTVEGEVERVLCAMRAKPQWYADYIERPLGAKTTPVAPAITDRNSAVVELPVLALVEPYEAEDARLAALADVALEAIEARLATDANLEAAVTWVVRAVFGDMDTAGELAHLPHGGPTADERISALITDPAELARIVRVVREILDANVEWVGDG